MVAYSCKPDKVKEIRLTKIVTGLQGLLTPLRHLTLQLSLKYFLIAVVQT
jgi:hypothetical protein